MNEIYPGYPSPMKTPLYWRDEQSGKLAEAVMAYFEPYTLENLEGDYSIPPLSPEHLKLIRDYLVYYIKAPCWKNNPHADSEEFAALDRLIEQAQKIENRKDIGDFVKDCMGLGLDPF